MSVKGDYLNRLKLSGILGLMAHDRSSNVIGLLCEREEWGEEDVK